MPLANVYTTDSKQAKLLGDLAQSIAVEIARELSGSERQLTPGEVSVRLIECKQGSSMIAPVEVEITAHIYKERIGKADHICNFLRGFIQSKLPEVSDVRVWLVLTELGHSWEE